MVLPSLEAAKITKQGTSISFPLLKLCDDLNYYQETVQRVIKEIKQVIETEKEPLVLYKEISYCVENCDLIGRINYCKTALTMSKAYKEYPFLLDLVETIEKSGEKLYQFSKMYNSSFIKPRANIESFSLFLKDIEHLSSESFEKFSEFMVAYSLLELSRLTRDELQRTIQQVEKSVDKKTAIFRQSEFLYYLNGALERLSSRQDNSSFKLFLERYRETVSDLYFSTRNLLSLISTKQKQEQEQDWESKVGEALLQYRQGIGELTHTAKGIEKELSEYLGSESLRNVASQARKEFVVREVSEDADATSLALYFISKLRDSFLERGINLFDRLSSHVSSSIKNLKILNGKFALEYDSLKKVIQLKTFGKEGLFHFDTLRFYQANPKSLIDSFIDSLLLSLDGDIHFHTGSTSFLVNDIHLYCNEQGTVTLDTLALSKRPPVINKSSYLSQAKNQENKEVSADLGSLSSLFGWFKEKMARPSSSRSQTVSQAVEVPKGNDGNTEINIYDYHLLVGNIIFSCVKDVYVSERENEKYQQPTCAELQLCVAAARYFGLNHLESVYGDLLKITESELLEKIKHGKISSLNIIPNYRSNNVKISYEDFKKMSVLVKNYIRDISKYTSAKEHIEGLLTKHTITRLIPPPPLNTQVVLPRSPDDNVSRTMTFNRSTSFGSRSTVQTERA